MTAFLAFWRDDKAVLYKRVGLRLEDTNLILDTAKKRHAVSVDSIYGEAMAEIARSRGG
jgi:hypothetical protein